MSYNAQFQLGKPIYSENSEGVLQNVDAIGLEFCVVFPGAETLPDAVPAHAYNTKVRVCRNVSGYALRPGATINLGASGLATAGEAISHCSAGHDIRVAQVDPWRTQNVEDDELFLAVVGGYTYMTLPATGGAFGGNIAVNSLLATGVGTSGENADSGRVALWTSATTLTLQQYAARLQAIIGYSLGTATTGDTDEKLLVFMGAGHKFF